MELARRWIAYLLSLWRFTLLQYSPCQEQRVLRLIVVTIENNLPPPAVSSQITAMTTVPWAGLRQQQADIAQLGER